MADGSFGILVGSGVVCYLTRPLWRSPAILLHPPPGLQLLPDLLCRHQTWTHLLRLLAHRFQAGQVALEVADGTN